MNRLSRTNGEKDLAVTQVSHPSDEGCGSLFAFRDVLETNRSITDAVADFNRARTDAVGQLARPAS